MSLRRTNTEIKYQVAKENGTLRGFEKSRHLQDFVYFYIVKNAFPYDSVFALSDMLISRRKFAHVWEMNVLEHEEYMSILERLNRSGIYSVVMDNFDNGRSVPGHFHVHLLRYINNREDIIL